MASTRSHAAFVCDVTTLVWDKFIQSDEYVFGKAGSSNSLSFSYVRGGAAVVRGTILCWFHNDFSFLPMDYEHVCLLWFDHSPYAPETSNRVLHCITVLVSIENARKPPIFKASVISFRSYVLKQQLGHIEAVVPST